jgi:cytoskeletal protein RodZ
MDFGSELRQAREKRGVTLKQIAEATKISVRSLEALERNELSQLPGGIFTRAFVRSYALEVGLDPDRALREFLSQFPDENSSPQPYAAESAEAPRNGTAANRLLIVVVLVTAVLAGTYYLMRSAGTPATAPRAPQTPAPATVTAPKSPAVQPAAAATPTDAVRGTAGEQAPAPDGLAVQIKALAPCWVVATSDGSRVLGRLMQPGESQALRAARRLVLEIGDAGAFTFTLNDRAGRPLGDAGEVVRVVITPDNYRTFLAAP